MTGVLALAFGLMTMGTTAPQENGLRTLAKGHQSGVTKSGERVVRTQAVWEKLWAEHVSIQEPKPPAPKVDFAREMVLVAAMGRKPTAGYAIEITGVKRQGKTLVVSVRHSAPPPGAIALQVITNPVHFIAVPRSDAALKYVTDNKGCRLPLSTRRR